MEQQGRTLIWNNKGEYCVSPLVLEYRKINTVARRLHKAYQLKVCALLYSYYDNTGRVGIRSVCYCRKHLWESLSREKKWN